MRGTTERHVFASSVLAGNPLGDPSTRDVWVYLPPGYAGDERRYPVLFLLAGFTGRGRGALSDSPWSPAVDDRMDRLLEAGEAEPAILVMPDCFTRLGGSQYLNSAATGRYEDYVCDELVPWTDATFRTLGTGHRGVFGKSSGGYGSMRLAMQRPGLFAAVGCHSGDCAFELCYQPDFPATARALERAGGVEAFLTAFEGSGEKKRGSDIQALNVLAMAAAYSPSREAPGGFDLPFDPRTCSIRDDVWQRWLEADPLRMLDGAACADALRDLRSLFIDVGSRDEFNLDFAARRLVAKLEALEVRHRYEEFDDTHRSISYRYDRSLPLLTRSLQ